MTVSSTNRKAGPYTGNGATVAFPFSFKVFAADELRVVRTDLAGLESDLSMGSDYSVTLNANQDATPGGTVTMAAAPGSGLLITITSKLPNLQPMDLTNQGAFYPKVLNNALDRLTILVQQLAEQVGRTLRTPISSNVSPDDIVSGLVTSAASAVAAADRALMEAANAAASADRAVSAAAAAVAAASAASGGGAPAVGGIPSVTTLPNNPADVGGTQVVFLATADTSQRAIWAWDGSAWKNTRDGANLIANSIAADRLSVSQLATISANMGALTSGSITLDSSGYIRGGSTGYLTGNGFWMGYHSGVYKMAVGNPAGAGFSWDGGTFTIRGADGSVLLASGTGVPYGALQGAPTSLAALSATDGTKLAGIDAGANATYLDASGNLQGVRSGAGTPVANAVLVPSITAAAGTAAWGGVSGAGKPQDNATVGATIGVNLGGQMTAANISTWIANAAIGSAQIGNAAIHSAHIQDAQVGTLKIQNNAVTIPAYAESGAKSITYQPPGLYDMAVSTVGILYPYAAKVLATFTMVGWPMSGSSGDNAAITIDFRWTGTPNGGGTSVDYVKTVVLGDYHVYPVTSTATATALLDIPYNNYVWSFSVWVRITVSGQSMNITRSSLQIMGVLK